jgi:Ca2+-binding RTX toxin-like protein
MGKGLKAATAAATILVVSGFIVGPAPAGATFRCFGRPATIVGTNGADDIRGTPGNDVIVLRGGHDSAGALAGNDRVCGGDGEDTINLGPGADRGSGGTADDGVSGGVGEDRLRGDAGFDFLFGEGGQDVSRGQAGGDTILDGIGADRVLGGAGNDFLHGGEGSDRLQGGTGSFDLASYFTAESGVTVDLAITGPQPTGQGLDRLTGVEGVDGSRHDDHLFGNDLATPFGNGLFGFQGLDTIDGRSRVDAIDGGPGGDTIHGGPGDDGFVDGECCGLLGGPGADQIFGDGGDDALLGQEGGDILTGGESAENGAGDFGSGGDGVDTCSELESDDGTCEILTPRAPVRRVASRSVGTTGWAAVADRWGRVGVRS